MLVYQRVLIQLWTFTCCHMLWVGSSGHKESRNSRKSQLLVALWGRPTKNPDVKLVWHPCFITYSYIMTSIQWPLLDHNILSLSLSPSLQIIIFGHQIKSNQIILFKYMWWWWMLVVDDINSGPIRCPSWVEPSWKAVGRHLGTIVIWWV